MIVNTEKISQLPGDWVETRLEEIVKYVKGKKPSSTTKNKKEGFYPYILIDQLEGKKPSFYTDDKKCPVCNKNDVLMVWDGSIGKNAIGLEGVVGSTIAALSSPIIISKLLKYFIDSKQSIIKASPRGSGLAHVNPEVFWNFKFNLASLPEQQQIIYKIEELLSDLDNSVDCLEKTRDHLKIYRQAILKSAFDGRLTADWRRGKRNLTSANDLIEQIKKEREGASDARYGKRQRKMDTSYMDVNQPPCDLPDQWVWCRIKDLISDLTDYHANGSYESLKANVALLDTPNYALMIRATNFEKNDFTTIAKYITKEAYEFLSRSKLFGNEILIGKIGNAGKVYLMPCLNKPSSLAMNLFALRFSIVNSRYIYYHLISPFSDKDIASYVKGVGNPTIDKISIRSLLIALPPLEEQEVIVQEIESLFSVCDQLEETIENSLTRADVLRQSILKQAFEGKLTEQWRAEYKDLISGENSAEALLKKIKAEKEASQAKPKGKKKHD